LHDSSRRESLGKREMRVRANWIGAFRKRGIGSTNHTKKAAAVAIMHSSASISVLTFNARVRTMHASECCVDVG
jgi:hypothetical protein